MVQTSGAGHMERATFGEVVAALRKEQIHFLKGQTWSQQDLAIESGLTMRIVGKIERGEQARLNDEMLRGLARAFNLTSLERREFFAMASEVSDRNIARRDLRSEDVLAEVWGLLEDLCTPAFLTDPLFDIVGVNRALLSFHGVSLVELQAFKNTPVGANVLGLVFSSGTSLRQMLRHEWESIAHANVQQWRMSTLRYRHTDRFHQLFAALSTFADFRLMWAAGNDVEHAIEDCSRIRRCVYSHGIHGPVAYTVFVNISMSAFGDLHLCTLVPMNKNTADIFLKLAGDNKGALPLCRWPNPSLVT